MDRVDLTKKGKETIFINRSLTWLTGGAILERPKTKNSYRRLKLAPELASALRLWKIKCAPNPNGIVFVNELGQPTSCKYNNHMLKACCERAKVKAFNMNNLRHSFASQHLITGTPPLKIFAMMSHSDPAVILKVYNRWAEGEESNVEALLAGRIFKAGEQEATGSE